MVNILQRFKSLDFLGAKFEMNIKGKPKYTTLMGTLFSISCVILLLLGFFVFTGNLTDKSSPEVTINSQILKEYPFMDLYNDSIVPGFSLFNGTHFVKNVDTYVYTKVLAMIITIDYKDVVSKIPTLEIIPIEYIPCTLVPQALLDTMTRFRKKPQEFLLNYGLCPDIANISNWYVQGMLSNPPFHYIQIHVLPCIETGLYPCKPFVDIIDTKIKMVIIEKAVDFSEVTDALEYNVNFDHEYYLNPAQTSRFSFFFKRNNIQNDMSDFLKPNEVVSFVDEEKIISTTGFRDGSVFCTPDQLSTTSFSCPPYVSFDLRSGAKLMTISRRYEKFFATISEIGGYTELVIVVFGLLYIIYNQYFYERFMRKEVVKMERDTIARLFEFEGANSNKLTQFLKNVVEKDFDAITLFREMNNFSVMENVIFEEHHKVLLPLVIIGIKNERRKSTLLAGKKKEIVEKKEKGEEYEDLIVAYNKLKGYHPSNEIEELVKDFFIKNVPENLKIDAQAMEVARNPMRAKYADQFQGEPAEAVSFEEDY